MMGPQRFESTHEDVNMLSKPLVYPFSRRKASNRFLKAAMTERLSSWSHDDLQSRGIPTTEMQNLYKSWGEGEIGTILTGNIIPEVDQVATAGDPVVPSGAPLSGKRFEAYKRLASLAKMHGSLILGQLNLPGRQIDSRIQSSPISASDVRQEGKFVGAHANPPRAATIEEIQGMIEGFAQTAAYLEQAGFDGIQLHAAHGYLIAQFLSPTINKRTDKYGGSLENRMRILLESAQAIRKRTRPDFILGVKLNSVDFQKDKGFSAEEAKQFCSAIEQNSFDFVELSGGGLEHFGHQRESTKQREGYFMEFADLMVPNFHRTKVFVTGGFKTVGAMERALKNVDGVGLGRPVCQEPHLCKDILAGKVRGALRQIPDEDNYLLTNVVAGSQIARIGRGEGPRDMTQEANVNTFTEAFGRWTEAAAKDTELRLYGYVHF